MKLTLDSKIALLHRIALVAILFFVLLNLPIKGRAIPSEAAMPKRDELRRIREKSLGLLRDIVPASNSGKGLKTLQNAGGIVYWGNLFDTREVTALVNLAPEAPEPNADYSFDHETWVCHLSFCAWEKGHWVFRQYLDNAKNLEFHDRKDKPSHFVQASRMTGRYEGDFLSWYYEPKTRKLVPTNFEDWGPFHLIGDYLCTVRGFERRAMDETVWVYAYKGGKKGNLLATYNSDIGRGELRNFSITFRDRKMGKYWTYSFNPVEAEPPYLHYVVDGREGKSGPLEKETPATHYHAEMQLKEEPNEALDNYCFERLTGLSRAVLNHEEGLTAGKWKDAIPKLPPLKRVKFTIAGDSRIVRHLQSP